MYTKATEVESNTQKNMVQRWSTKEGGRGRLLEKVIHESDTKE